MIWTSCPRARNAPTSMRSYRKPPEIRSRLPYTTKAIRIARSRRQQQDLNGAVGLAIQHLVRPLRVVEREPMSDQGRDVAGGERAPGGAKAARSIPPARQRRRDPADLTAGDRQTSAVKGATQIDRRTLGAI